MSVKANKLLIIAQIFVLNCFAASLGQAQEYASETLDARKGLFRLLSANEYEVGDYNVRTSIQYARDTDLLEDNRTVEAAQALIAFGYAILPYLQLSAQGGLDISARDLGPQSQTYNLFRFSSALTSAYDLGKRWGWQARRMTVGGSLWVDFSKITRFFKAANIVPTLTLSTDWSDQKIPFRAHFNTSFVPANGGRFFDTNARDQSSNPSVKDFDRFATKTINSYGIGAGAGIEFPFRVVIPSTEVHMLYVQDVGFMDSPKWVTIGLKGRPFPQKNIELFAAADMGLSTYTPTAVTEKPKTYAVPTWNAVVGFGLSQFGKKEGELAVDARLYQRTLDDLDSKNQTLADLRKDLAYNTVTGRVIDAETKSPLAEVTIGFPEQTNIRSFKTGEDGRFKRYYPLLEGARIQFSKDGYEPSSKYLSLKPGESVTIDIELKKGIKNKIGNLVLNIADDSGKSVSASIVLRNLASNEETRGSTDSLGKLNIQLPEGQYQIEISAPGFNSRRDRLQIEAGKAVLRTYTVTRP
ncbi:MAG: hypothetical protein COV44_03040 [Deltaproteobacteria bacterium CG11_big_fil_rev_8_21_14_0_20_45_16]|nr:MAG: hypothetical protein COV44_03040 [Deltaproteobacteria bacterium CG11_big_fil_rev_8_21_14_0_20_45_16]